MIQQEWKDLTNTQQQQQDASPPHYDAPSPGWGQPTSNLATLPQGPSLVPSPETPRPNVSYINYIELSVVTTD